MSSTKCPNCRKEYNGKPDKNGIIVCPFCGYNPTRGKPVTPIRESQFNPPKPKFSAGYIVTCAFGVICMLLSIPLFEDDDSFGGTYLFLFGLVFVGIALVFYFKKLSRYHLSIDDPEAYKSLIADEQRAMEAQAKADLERNRAAAAKRQEELAKTPHCPVCNSQDIIRLSTMNRAVSVAAFGLASSKIGKQYQCKNCKHMW